MNKLWIVISILVVLAATYGLTREKLARAPGVPGVCTQEALMCPDGSSVGRSGPQCTFAKCPDTAATYTGTLTQQDGKFMLVIAAPANSPKEVTYAMPIELKVSNVVGQLIGQEVTVKGSFTEGNTLHVDSLEETKTNGGDTVEVGIGKTGYANGVKITLNKIIQDNRCPVDVQCIEAGAVTANVTLKSDTDTETFNMPSDEVPHGFDSFKVSIVAVKPSRVVAHAPDPNSYVVTFKVEKLTATDTKTFSGTITSYSTACFADGICSVTVGGKVVIITAGYRINVPPVGRLEGVESISDLGTKIGHTATVYAHKNSDTEYTLYGNESYYVKVQ